MKLVIIDYGAGNIQSIKFAFQRLGVEAQLSNDVETIKNADKVIDLNILVGIILSNTTIWKKDLTNFEGLVEMVSINILSMDSIGVHETLKKLEDDN